MRRSVKFKMAAQEAADTSLVVSSNDLEEKWDKAVRDIATKRKTTTSACRKAYARKIEKNIENLEKIKVNPPEAKACPEVNIHLNDNLFTKLKDMKDRLSHLSQNSTSLLEKAVRLTTAIDIENSNKNTTRKDDGCSSPERKRVRTHTTPTKSESTNCVRRSPRLKSCSTRK